MDPIADVSARIADIQTRLTSLRPAGVPFAEVLAASTPTTARSTAGSTGLDPASLASAAARPAWATTSGTSTGTAASAAASSGSAGTSAPARGVAATMAELRAYGNGRIPASALTPIGHGSHRLAAPAAEAWTRLEAAAKAAGVRIGVTDSYRSYDAQVDVARRKGLYSQGGLAAKPGTSQHGWGMAVDLDLDRSAQAWMRTNAGRFGFVEDTPREPWHWAYKG